MLPPLPQAENAFSPPFLCRDSVIINVLLTGSCACQPQAIAVFALSELGGDRAIFGCQTPSKVYVCLRHLCVKAIKAV